MDTMLFMDPSSPYHENRLSIPTFTTSTNSNTGLLSNITHATSSAATTATRSVLSRSTRSYDLVDGGSERGTDDFLSFSGNTSPLLSEGSKGDDGTGLQRRRHNNSTNDFTTSPARFDDVEEEEESPAVARSRSSTNAVPLHQPVVRRASTKGVTVRHPTPGLQTLKGAYTANVAHLEQSAEKLSMTSSIEDSIRKAYDEQKRSDSRQSSMRQSSLMDIMTSFASDADGRQFASPSQITSPTQFASPTQITSPTQFASPTSIIDVNGAARLGGYSPGGAVLMKGRADSRSSKTSNYGMRPEPELEGRPLDQFVSLSRQNSYMSSHLSRSASIAERDEEAGETRQPLAIRNLSHDDIDVDDERNDLSLEPESPVTADTQSEMENAQQLFDDFDGQHYANSIPPAPAPAPEPAPEPRPNLEERRSSSGNTLTMARPKSYADPLTGQQMIFYPAPVPSMLQLPQRLSMRPSPATREKRRTQVLANIPPAARQSAIWLPDVVEAEPGETDSVRASQYLPENLRQSTGDLRQSTGDLRQSAIDRRATQDLSHMPDQLRANTFFEQPPAHQLVEIKEQSAVKTLDDILDASAFAPVTAFTGHAFAGTLGAEIYGTDDHRRTRTKSQLLLPAAEPAKQKRASSFFGLRGGDKSAEKLATRRTTTMSSMLGLDKSPAYEPVDADKSSPRLPDDDNDAADSDPEQPPHEQMDERYAEEMYTGAPTTLLAELQLRKQQAKARTQPSLAPGGFRSTLLEMDAVAGVSSRTRQQKRVTLAWQGRAAAQEQAAQDDDDDDVPLGVLFPEQARQQLDTAARPMGLMERREMEDNEPLSRRRDRLLGRQRLQREPLRRGSPMLGLPAAGGHNGSSETITPEGEENALPSARPVSGAFSSELLHQFGGDEAAAAAGAEAEGAVAEENETLGQRRRRLIAEREAREREVAAQAPAQAAAGGALGPRPPLKQRRSMADLLGAHPAKGAGHAREGSREFPHLREHQMYQQQQQMQQQQQYAQPQQYTPQQQYAQPQQYAMPQQYALPQQYAQQQYAPPDEAMATRMMQMRVRAQQAAAQQQPQPQAQMGAGWQEQQAQWQYWARMQGMPAGAGAGGVDMVEQWRRSVLSHGGA